MTQHSGGLTAHTTRIDGAVDLAATAGPDGWLFQHGDTGVAGRGVALRIDLPVGDGRLTAAADVVAAALDAIEADDHVGLPGCGPIAVGALPFSDRARASMVVPEVVVGRAGDGTTWMTTISTDGPSTDGPSPTTAEATERARTAPATAYRVAPSRPPSTWCAAVGSVRDAVRRGELVKAVLAREVVVEADGSLDPMAIVQRLRAAYPSCHVFSVDGLVGASPELLVSRAGDLVRSQPMAGTARRSGDPTTDAHLAAGLLASAKDRQEHQVTIDMVHDTLLPFCSYLDAEAQPSVVSVANVSHLATMVHGRLSQPPASALALAAALHPTPAVCGQPRAAAMALIDGLEDLDRGRYAGPVGWVDQRGNGTFAVAIRCAEIDGSRARLFAGVGVVGDSDPEAELAETQLKLQPLLSAIVRP